jgi:hypothetical protein
MLTWPIHWTSLEPLSYEEFEYWLAAEDWFAQEAGSSGELIPHVAIKGINRIARLKAIGNGQVPAVARKIWNILTNIK